MPQTTIYVSPRSLGAPDSRPPAVVTTDLARLFAGSPALAGVSLQIQAGLTVALLGPNGAGKTTLLRLLSTAIRPSYGSARVDGLDLDRDAALVRERVALVDDLLVAWHEVGVTVLIASHSTERFDPLLDGRVTLERGLV